MKTLKNKFFSDYLLLLGFLFILVSFIIFLLPDLGWIQVKGDGFFGLFFANYIFSSVYLFVLLINGIIHFKWSFFKINTEYTILLQILYLISAFSLNRQIPVFERSADWVCVYLVAQCVTLMLLTFRQNLPVWLNYVLHVILGTGTVLYLYYAIYLMPLYPLCFIGGIFLGISWHVFVPVFFIFFTVSLLLKSRRENSRYFKLFWAGFFIPVIAAIVFVVEWNATKSRVNYEMNEAIVHESDLPSWVRISKSLPANSITEKMLKTGLVYSAVNADNVFWNWSPPDRSFDEVKLHDPLVMVATLFTGTPDLAEKEKINILEAMYDSRHQAQERLWAGDDLQTANVISNIRIFPEYRMAYTEKILSIHHKDVKNRWQNQQEAIYTFHLPEGSVVTSLSLWIGGKEEKAMLTTKHKADSAYKTIVGVEQRDPSVVHWQEGNTVSVRIFPCTPEENRRVKIGITSPLRKDGQQLVYENIYFDGPSGKGATESVHLQFTKAPGAPVFPFSFSQDKGTGYRAEKTYDPYWEIRFDAPALATGAFSFDGRSYAVSEYKPVTEAFKASAVYLDLNRSWSREELDTLWPLISSREVYVSQEEHLVKVTSENMDELFEQGTKEQFSLFPFYLVKDPQDALIVSKSSGVSPNLKDLKDSEFSKKLTAYLESGIKVRMFNIGHELSPYLKTLKELRVLIYESGDAGELAGLLKKNEYTRYAETDSALVIDHAQLMISEYAGTAAGNAPDHLLRLFAYNDIMRKTGSSYFTGTYINNELIDEAEKSYVISPVSSLIVLEKQEDYEQFGITNSRNSLSNASMKSSGAVPEPHEWLLIILAGGAMIYLVFRSKVQPGRI